MGALPTRSSRIALPLRCALDIRALQQMHPRQDISPDIFFGQDHDQHGQYYGERNDWLQADMHRVLCGTPALSNIDFGSSSCFKFVHYHFLEKM